jgi:aspartate aminotransferase-like enzyme
MKTYPIPMVPGPVSVPIEVLQAYQVNYGSSDIEPEFLELYNKAEANLQKIYATKNSVVIQTGEGMMALWGALKSCLNPEDRVLCISTGLFGSGIGDMALTIGAKVRRVDFEFNQTINDWKRVEEAIVEFKPKMITSVHCETPSGTLNPIAELGQLKAKHNIPLLYVDAVSSAGGTPVLTDEWHIDLALGGAQKCISAPAGTSFLTVSPQAWEIIERVDYAGYDALKPFITAQRDFYFPYTPYWHGIAALNSALERLLEEGLQSVYERHEAVATYCRQRLETLGLVLYPVPGAVNSPTITAVNVPKKTTWEELDEKFRQRGLVVGGNFGSLAGKVFRIGHMGTQANMQLVTRALDVIEEVMKEIR